MLESYNHSPRISLKVRAVNSEEKIDRKSLTKFREFLALEFEDEKPRCFYSGEILEKKDISVDHVIPWSFMFSDDIWNLVYCTKTKNSSKSNSVIGEDGIKKLEERNRRLLECFEIEGIDGKIIDEFRLAIEKNYVRQFWIGAKG